MSSIVYALKEINKKTVTNVLLRCDNRFEELDIIHKCHNLDVPNVLELIESFEDDENYYVVTRFLEGGALLDYIVSEQGDTRDEKLIRSIMLQVAVGLKGLHDLNIFHRDIKLENILVSDKSRNAKVFLADFGSAVQLRNKSDTVNFRIGTAGFMPPELLYAEPYGLPGDIWSLGCILYALITFEPPFWHDSADKRNKAVCK